jgi:hypothetical protein
VHDDDVEFGVGDGAAGVEVDHGLSDLGDAGLEDGVGAFLVGGEMRGATMGFLRQHREMAGFSDSLDRRIRGSPARIGARTLFRVEEEIPKDPK